MFMVTKMRLTSLLAAFVVVAGLAATAQATIHPLTGNIRFQIGDGLPIPITFQPAPNGAILAIPGAIVSQPPGTGAARDIIFVNGGEFIYAVATRNLPVFLLNSQVYQVKTSLGITYPLNPGSQLSSRKTSTSVRGRTGGPTVSFCDGNGTITGNNNPACPNGMGITTLPGIMIYTRTSNQFGGALTGRVFGGADVALNGQGANQPPCAGSECKVLMALANPNSTGDGGAGDAFGGGGTSPGTPVDPGAFTASITAAGKITTVGVFSGPGIGNAATGAGAPWTTGMVTVSMSQAVGSAEIFTLTGSDNRTAGGAGTISLVAASLSQRATSGPNANRGWINMTLGNALGALPTISGPGIAALVGLMSLAGGYAMRQRNRK
jgi:hypothetical protein